MNLKELYAARALVLKMRQVFGDLTALSLEVIDQEPEIKSLYEQVHLSIVGLTEVYVMLKPVKPRKKYPFKPATSRSSDEDIELLSRGVLRYRLRCLGDQEEIDHLTVLELRKRLENRRKETT